MAEGGRGTSLYCKPETHSEEEVEATHSSVTPVTMDPGATESSLWSPRLGSLKGGRLHEELFWK